MCAFFMFDNHGVITFHANLCPSLGAVSTDVFASIFPSAIAPLHLQGTHPPNHGRKIGYICVFAPKTEAMETAF
jgi:hypothetical protein